MGFGDILESLAYKVFDQAVKHSGAAIDRRAQRENWSDEQRERAEERRQEFISKFEQRDMERNRRKTEMADEDEWEEYYYSIF